MLDSIINFELLRNPLNWITVWIAVFILAIAAHAVLPTLDSNYHSNNS